MSLLCLVVVLSLSAPATRGANILFVSSMTAVEDDALKAFMEGLGHTVTYIDDDEDEATTEAAAAAADLVFISESVGSGGIKNEITEVEVPMIVGEPWAWDEMGLTEGSGGDDPAVTTDVEIVDPGHYLAAGLSGPVAVLTEILEGCNLGKGVTGSEATVIATATLSDGVTYDVIFVYEKGAALPVAPADGSAQVAADIRIGFGLHANCYPALSENAFVLLGAAIDYALGQTGPDAVTTGHVYLLENVSDSNVPDDSANDNTGIIVGDPQVIDGLNGKALLFDGVDDGVDIPDSEFINVTGGPFPNRTVIAVFKCDDVNKQGKQTVFEEGGLTRGLTIYVFNGEVYVGGWNKADYEPQWNPGSWMSAPINSNQWYAVALVIRDGTPAQEDDKFEMWMNGNLIGKAPGAEIWNHGNDNAIGYTNQNVVFHDGDGSGDGWFFEGAVDELWILNDALTEAELGAWVGGEQVDMEIGFAIQPPVIDGEVDGIWAGASTQNIIPQDDPANTSGSWKALYDSENLYVIVDITDDSLQNDSAGSWQDDSVELYFDGGNTKVDTPLSGDDHQYTFGWTTDEIQGTNIDGYTEGIEHAQVDTDTGWRIEIKLPWLSIQGAAPQARDLIGIDCFYNDDDDGGDSREAQIWTFATDGSAWNDASQWGTATLAIIRKPVDPGTDGLVAFYALDGDPNDSSGNELHGTIVGEPAFVEGQVGMALDFDGTDDVVELGKIDVVGGITLAAWIKPDDFGINDARMITKANEWSGDSHWWMLSTISETSLRFRLKTDEGPATATLISDPVLEAGVWAHVVASWDGSMMRIYKDGIEIANQEKGGTAVAVDPNISAAIGSQPSDAFASDPSHVAKFFDGLIDEVQIYERALSGGEIRYLAGERAVDPSLVIYYSFDDVGEIVADQSGKGHDGVVVGDVTAEAEGMISGAANFANGGYLDLDGPSIPAEDIPTSAMTLAAWIKIANTGGDHEIFNARASDESWLIHPEPKSSGDIRWLLRSYGGTTIFQIRAGTVTWDEWLHFAGTYDKDSGKAALYINGELIEEMDVTDPADIAGDWDLGARVGKTIDDGRPFTGLMDEFRMYKRALSQDEILEVMQGM
jgi:hypothetical protein